MREDRFRESPFTLPDALGRHGRPGRINNAAYVDYLQEARVDYLLAGPPADARCWTTGCWWSTTRSNTCGPSTSVIVRW